ncbi:RHS repeat-associated core domain-containing protein [Arthrobacter sp. FB24]|uniref:RHS repeat-associated core domain-containing protein n=1 Tax=Arthrobacter sp. (strain FB24) TaxID=290399 RepID=UPI0002D3466E|nr:RHS repeat-associated core domain-containing protein [Arthrobacter sp. FB24]
MVLPPASGADGIKSGNRSAAAMITRQLTDLSALSYNPTNGNVVLTGQLLHVKGANRDLSIGWRYNSINDVRPTLSVGAVEAGVTVGTGNSVTYTAPDGGTYTFVSAGAGVWTMPPGLNATITVFTSTAITIRFNDTGFTNEYELVGSVFRLKYMNDQNASSPNRITYTYNGSGQLSTINDTIGGRPVTFSYSDPNNAEQPSSIHDDALSRTISLEYSGPNGAMSRITDATGAVMDFGYGAPSDRITTVTDDAGTVTTLAYDTPQKRLGQATYATGTAVQSVWQYSYLIDPVNGFFAYVKDPNLNTTQFRSSAANQNAQTQDPLGHQSQFLVDAHDNVTNTATSLGYSTTYTYNTNNSLTKITSPAAAGGGTGGEISFTYPTNTGNPLSNYQPNTSISSENQTTSYSYDANTNNRYQTTTPGTGGGAGGTPKLNYQGDAAGTTCGAKKGQVCKSTDGNGNITTYTYGALGMPTTITRPSPLGTITNVYDDASRLITSTDGKGQTAHYDYDDNDRLVQIDRGVNCATLCVSYVYDGRGNLIEREDDTGITTYAWDLQNRPQSKTIGGVTTSVTYDGASNILTSVDPLGTVTYKYDAASRLISLAEPGGSCPGTPAFPNATKCTGFDYDNDNRRTAVKYPTGVKNTTVYDNNSRITSITATNTSAGILAKRAYTYTMNGTKDGALRKTMTDQAGTVTTYSYDPMNRLSQAVTGTVTETWTYDKNANRTKDTKTGTADVYNAYNAADQLCWAGSSAGTCASPPGGATTYSYDANGNTTVAGATTQGYNVFDQFTSNSNGGTTNYTYTGSRNDERLTAGSTAFLNGSLGITRQTTGGASTSFIRDPQGTLISMRTSTGASFYYTTDALGSIILLTDSAQAAAATYAYDSWGLTTASSGAQAATNPWTYAGGYNDTTSNRIKFGARYYNPYRGRFTQPDPSNQEANRYAYAGCNPINSTDPSGLASQECIGQAGQSGAALFVAMFAAMAVITLTGGAALAAAGVAISTFGGGIFSGISAAATCRR